MVSVSSKNIASVSTLLVRNELASTPDKVATIPDMVGIVAAETPAAIERALPPE